jgi:serine protease Do
MPGFNGQSPQLEEFFRRFFDQLPNMQNRQAPEEQPYVRKTTAVGSGFVIDPDGLVVTNYHVIKNADEIEVVFDDGTRVPATLRGTDEKTDLALLQIDTDGPLPYVVFGNSDDAEVGDWVIAIGNPFGLGGTTTSGIISARGRDIRSGPLDDFIQIDASINRGNSGGPLFNTRGEVIGVNSAIYSPNGGSVGIGFAIPSSMASNVIGQLQQTGSVERGYLGVHIQAVSEEIAQSLGLDDDSGALVTQVMEDSPAEKAGIEAGDVILSFDGKKLDRMRDLPKFVALTPKGKSVKVKVWRNEDRKTLKVKVGSNEAPKLAGNAEQQQEHQALGLKLQPAVGGDLEKYALDEDTVGVIIVDVAPHSPAAQKGLREGDVIKRVNNNDVTVPGDVYAEIAASKAARKESVLLLVERNNQARFVVVPIQT